jgi:Xaa-Pro aminopeptidase
MTLIQEKVKQAVSLLKEFDIDCWITFTRESQMNGDPTLAYLAPGDVTWHSLFIISAEGRATAIVGRYDQRTIEETGAYDEVIGFVTGFKEPLLDTLKSLGPGKIGINYSKDSEICDGLTHGLYLTLQEALSEIGMAGRLVSAEKIVSALRERKTAAEVARLREAILKTEEIFAEVAGFIRPGQTEKEIAAFMLNRVKKQNLELAWGQSTCPAIFSGPDTAAAHYAPTDRRVERGHVLNMDFGLKVEAYCSDLQRTFYILGQKEKEAPAEVKKGFETIVLAVDSAKRAMNPGRQGFEIDALARQILKAAGYDEFPHALGHQVGRFPHDGTALLGPPWEKYAQKPFQRLEEGMVFTIEPRLTVPGRGVVTVEEMVVLSKDGAEWLSTPQKELFYIR